MTRTAYEHDRDETRVPLTAREPRGLRWVVREVVREHLKRMGSAAATASKNVPPALMDSASRSFYGRPGRYLMRLADLIETVSATSGDDWSHAGVDGYFRELSITSFGIDDRAPWKLEIESHDGSAVLREDVRVMLVWGMGHDSFQEEWATRFPDENAFRSYVDLFFCGAPVLRTAIVYVDGARYLLPMPHPGTLEVPEQRVRFTKAVCDVAIPASDFGEAMRRAGLVSVPGNWP